MAAAGFSRPISCPHSAAPCTVRVRSPCTMLEVREEQRRADARVGMEKQCTVCPPPPLVSTGNALRSSSFPPSRLFSTAPYLFLRGWLWQTLVFRRKVALLSLKNKASLGALGCFRPQRAPTSFHISWIWGSQAAQCDGGFAVHLGCAPVYGSLAYLSVPLCFLGFSPLKLCFFSLLPSPQGNSILCFQQLSVS